MGTTLLIGTGTGDEATALSGSTATGSNYNTNPTPDEVSRRVSLASRFEDLAQQGALAQAVKENRPEVDACRRVLQKPIGKRTLDDVYMLKSLLSASRLLDFFSNLDAYKIDRLYQALVLTTFEAAGAFVFREGDPGDKFYMVFTGEVEIVRHDDVAAETGRQLTTTDAVLRLAQLRPGDTFGERAIVSDTDTRAASAVVTHTPTELVCISRVLFQDLLRESQAADAGSSNSTNALERRFRSHKDILRTIFGRAAAQRSAKDLAFAVESLARIQFFSRFSFEVRKQLCRALRLISAVTSTVIFAQGEVGRHFYILFTGSVEVTVAVQSTDRFGGDASAASTNVVVSRLGEGESFGELALSEVDGVRRATVTCTDYCELLVLSREQYAPLIEAFQHASVAQYAHLIRQNAYFTGPAWDDATIEGMCAVMTEKYVPFKGEICKQGSRATELFIVTRGECRMLHEGRDPVTHALQLFELGRFGPNAVIGCAEASAGKFNDIVVRDYAVVAASPVKMLVLSRFDIFHLMSHDARASLQRTAVDSVHESIASRALKTVAWHKFRAKFLTDVLASNRSHGHGASLPSPKRGGHTLQQMTTSLSTPVLPTQLQQLVAPGTLVLTPTHMSGDDKPVTASRRHSLTGVGSNSHTMPLCLDSDRLDASPIRSDSSTSPHDNALAVDTTTQQRRQSVFAAGSSGSPFALSRSRTLAALRASGASGSALPSLRTDKPLLDPSITARHSSSQSNTTTAGAAKASDLQRPVSSNSTQPQRAVSAIWSPVHGVCQPFGLLGFRTDAGAVRMSSATTAAASKARGHAAPPSLGSAHVHSANVHSATATAANAVVPGSRFSSSSHRQQQQSLLTVSGSAAAPSDSDTVSSITAFRVFGKFCDMSDALRMFHRVCSVECVAPVASSRHTTSRFAIYKDDDMTMALENFYGPSDPPATVAVGGPIVSAPAVAVGREPLYFRATDVVLGTGQRFACVRVVLSAPPLTAIESVAVHVYQCFPTLQSAVRFARQMATATLSVAALFVVPLFDWIPLAELERFDARNADLEQALESVMDSGGAGASAYRSTWKARKDAVKKARAAQPRSSKSKSS